MIMDDRIIYHQVPVVHSGTHLYVMAEIGRDEAYVSLSYYNGVSL